MLTTDDIRAIGELFIAEREQTRKIVGEETRKIVKEELVANNTVIGTIVRVEIATAKQEIAATVTTGFRETVKRINQLDERVEELEKETGLPHPHKH